MWEPARAGAAAAEASLETAAAELRERRYRARIAADYATRLTQVEALEAKLRQVKSEPEFMRDIEALVAGSGAAVTQFSSRSAEQSASAGTSYFEFYLNGSYASLRKFITALPDLNEFVAVERISLERNGHGGAGLPRAPAALQGRVTAIRSSASRRPPQGERGPELSDFVALPASAR